MGMGGPSPGVSGWGLKLAVHLHPAVRLRMTGDVLPLPVYAFMAWRGQALFCHFTVVFRLVRTVVYNFMIYTAHV